MNSSDTELGVMRTMPESSRDLATDMLPAGVAERTSQRRWYLSPAVEDP